jgi:hypothetical protein
MKPPSLPRPDLGFPDQRWPDRVREAAAAAERNGLDLKVELAAGASEEELARLETTQGRLPADLRALLRGASGGRLGHLDLLGAADVGLETARMRAAWGARGRPTLPGIEVETLFAIARDLAGSVYAAREPRDAKEHAVVYLCDDRAGAEHRFTKVSAFLESALARAHAAALHRKAEADAGSDLDDAPWTGAARALEAAIDSNMMRTRDD